MVWGKRVTYEPYQGLRKRGKKDVIRGWTDTKLGTVLELAYGKSLPKKSRKVGPYPVYGSNGVVGYHNEAAVQGPGIIVGRKGSCGEVHYCDCDFWPIDTTYYVALKENTNLRFVAYLLSSMGMREMNSHSTIPGLNRERVYHLPVSLPPVPEQKKIAAVLFKIQRAIETQEKIIQSLSDLKKSTMQHLFTHGLRGEKTKMSEIGEIPESWQIRRFGNFTTLHRGYDLPVYARIQGNVPIVGSNGIVGYHNEAKVEGPGVVTGRSGSIGLSHYIDEDYWPLNTGLYVSDFHGNYPLYVHYFFEWFDFHQYAAGVSVPTLNRNLVHAASIPVPDIAEQEDVALILASIDTKQTLHESKKSALQDLFKTTLNKLITCGIRVTDLDIDASEVN